MADLIRLAWKRLGAEAATLRVRDIAPVDPKSRNDIFPYFFHFLFFLDLFKERRKMVKDDMDLIELIVFV